ncbi:MAG: ECF-type sigma factor [Luteolibacter sp.]
MSAESAGKNPNARHIFSTRECADLTSDGIKVWPSAGSPAISSGMPDPPPRTPEPDGELSSDQLLPLVYEELRAMAAAKMADQAVGHTLQPTALVHEAWLRLNHGGRLWESRSQFYRTAAVAMRSILIDHARRKSSLKRTGGQRLDISRLDPAAVEPGEHMLLVDEGLKRLEHDDPESAEIVMLKFFSGLSNKDTARTLGLSEATVERRWAFAKVCLIRIMRELADSEIGD